MDYDIKTLTPVEEYRGILYKRDDKYMPFSDIPLSGGKVRQALCLALDNYDYIKSECGGRIATATSVNSPQGVIVAKIAKEFGFSCLLVVGATNMQSIEKNKLMRRSLDLNAKIDCEARMAYENVLTARINELCSHERYFIIKFGINLHNNPKAIIESTSFQTQNLPRDLDILVVNIGSGITFGGILKGLVQYDIKPKRVIGVQIAGYDRIKVIDKTSGEYYYDYEYIADKTYPYSRHVKVKFSDEEYLDPVYEAKAYNWMIKNIDYKNNKTLFWIVGNSSFIRK